MSELNAGVEPYMTENASNRRAYLRFPMDTLVWWNQDWEPEPVTLIDLSAGGMQIELPQPLDKGREIELHFEFPGHDRLILCHCEVMHSRKDDTFYKVGLRITNIEGMDQQTFIERIKNGLPS